jgi:endonuclease YncB( thermonuclease family)
VPAKRPRFERIEAMPRWTRPGHALRPRWRSMLPTIAGILLLAAAAVVAAWLDPLPPRFSGTARASDGDSIVLQGDRIRLLGIDAPELDQVCWDADGAEWRCGRAARDEMARRLASGPVDCATRGEDKYRRTLAYCTVSDADLGAHMVGLGLALATDGYGAQQAAARSQRLGLWQGRFIDPKTWRDDGPSGDPGPGPLQAVWDWFRELTGARTLR